MEWEYNDGGRAQAGYKGHASDCVTRAIAIATDRDYQEVYDLVNSYGRAERKREDGKKSSAREGVRKSTTRKVIASLGYEWMPTMAIGSGCRVHLKKDELPSGRIIVNLSRHICAVIDGIIYDTGDPSRDETRCVYGYWKQRVEL